MVFSLYSHNFLYDLIWRSLNTHHHMQLWLHALSLTSAPMAKWQSQQHDVWTYLPKWGIPVYILWHSCTCTKGILVLSFQTGGNLRDVFLQLYNAVWGKLLNGSHQHTLTMVGSMCSMKRHDKHLDSFHVQPTPGLQPGDNDLYLQFWRWLLHKTVEEPNILTRVLWNDEAGFMSGVDSLHNVHEWALLLDALHFRNDVWAGIIDRCITGPIQNQGSSWWICMLIYFKGHFPMGSPISWPPCSPDFTPTGFYLWWCIKEKVYAVKFKVMMT
jgi:hypothetical protein